MNRPTSAIVGLYRASDIVQNPYDNLVNTPGTSYNDLLAPNTSCFEKCTEKMADFTRQCWQNFKRPHVVSKLIILALSASVLGSYIGVFPWIFQLGNHHQMVLTHVTCGAMIAITAATWIGHIFNQDMPRYLSVVYDVIGAVLFLAVSGICFAVYARRPKAATHNVIPGYHVDGHLDTGRMLAAAILALFTTLAYIADIIILLKVNFIK